MKNKLFAAVLGSTLLFGLSAYSYDYYEFDSAEGEIVEFHIEDGTGDGAWNTKETIVEVKIGDTLRFYNDDSIRHRLHTNGAPCSHGPNFGPGETWDCEISRAFDAEEEGALYDHNFGPTAKFWVKTVE